MPTYEFKCFDCKIIIQEDHPMKDAPSGTDCPKCDKPVKRHYGQMSFICIGEGWPSKDIKAGKSPTGATKKPGINTGAKSLDNIMNERLKAGMTQGTKDVPMSNDEFKRRKALNQRWIDENS